MLKRCRHCRTERKAHELVYIMGHIYCGPECRQGHLDQKNAKRQIAKRAALEIPKARVGDWLDLPLIPRAEYLQAHGPQIYTQETE